MRYRINPANNAGTSTNDVVQCTAAYALWRTIIQEILCDARSGSLIGRWLWHQSNGTPQCCAARLIEDGDNKAIRRLMHSVELSPIHTADADATQLSSWVASAVRIEFATSWRQSRRVWTICRQRSRVASCRRCEGTSRQSWSSLQFSASVIISCRIVKWVTTADGRVHTADTTQLDRINSQHVQFTNFRRQSSAVVVS